MGNHDTSTSVPNDDDSRATEVNLARNYWIGRLIDLSRRNNLLFFRELKLGTLDLRDTPGAVESLVGGEPFVIQPSSVEIRGRLMQIRKKALENAEERGLETLYVGIGMVHWAEEDGGTAGSAPLLLIPVELRPRGREGASFTLERSGEPEVNPALIHRFKLLGAEVDPVSLLSAMQPGVQCYEDSTAVFRRLSALVVDTIKDFSIEDRAVLGNFFFQKMAIVRDLEEHGDALAAHDLVAALAGNAEARAVVMGQRRELSLNSIDLTPATDDFCILDADSSQQRVIAAARVPQSGVIQGPPGTGKSQTIANLIAALAASEKRVLFVSEKRAALDVVLQRLEDAGLGMLALDLHGADVTRKKVASKLAQRLASVKGAVAPDADVVMARLEQRRSQLNAHVERLHQIRPPSNKSIYSLQGELLALPKAASNPVRWRGPALLAMEARQAVEVRDILTELAADAGLFLRDGSCPWVGAELLDGAAAQAAIALADALPSEADEATTASEGVAKRAGLDIPRTVDESRLQWKVLSRVDRTLSVYSPALFTEHLWQLGRALAPVQKGFLVRAFARYFDPKYKAALRIVSGLRLVPVKGTILLEEVLDAAAALDELRAISSTAAAGRIEGLDAAGVRLAALEATAARLGAYLERTLDDLPFSTLTELGRALSEDTVAPFRIPHLLERERELERLGAGTSVAYLRAARPHSDLLASGLRIRLAPFVSRCCLGRGQRASGIRRPKPRAADSRLLFIGTTLT